MASKMVLVALKMPPDMRDELSQRAGGPGRFSATMRRYIQAGMAMERVLEYAEPRPAAATGGDNDGQRGEHA